MPKSEYPCAITGYFIFVFKKNENSSFPVDLISLSFIIVNSSGFINDIDQ